MLTPTDLHDRAIWLFDLDGTLVDTAPDLHAALQHALAAHGHPPTDYDRTRAFVGAGARAMIERALAHHALAVDEDHVESMLAQFLAHYGAAPTANSEPFDGAAELLDALAGRGARIACVTNKPEHLARSVLAGVGLDDHVALLLGGDSLERRKPDPLPLHHACRAFAGEAANAVMVGDSTTDVHAARAAGMPCVCVRFGYHGDTAPEDLGADLLVDSLRELLPAQA